MTTLVIKNKGLIESGDLTLIGSSTKRKDDSKIGMYGSGNKYALAWFLRNNINIRIFSGEKEINLSHEIVKHRGMDIAVLTVDGERTSITSEMGPEWTGWMALRELISNAIDEGEHEILTAFNSDAKGLSDNTMIHIPLNNELNVVIRNYDYYFSFDRKPSYSNVNGSVYIKSEPSIQNFYRKGIKCYDEKEKKTYLDYNLNNVVISESRVCDMYEKINCIREFIKKSDDIPKDILLMAIKDESISPYFNRAHVPQIKELIKDGYSFTSQKLVKLIGNLFSGADSENTIIIPHNWWEELSKLGIFENPFKFSEVDFIENVEYDFSSVKYILLALGMEEIDVFAGKMDCNTDVVSNNNGNQFFIKDTCDLSPEMIVSKIIKKLPETIIINKIINKIIN
jgi:hypothetical protein